jgi:hypothetical protein
MSDDTAAKIAEIQARRDARKDAAAAASTAQHLVDLEAIDKLESEPDCGELAVLRLPSHTPGLPVLAAARAPRPVEVKRYRDSVKPNRKGDPPDYAAAATQLAAIVRVYPDKEVYEAMCEACPGLPVQLGTAALELVTARDAAAGKD